MPNNHAMTPSRNRNCLGFTLIELMISVAIGGLLLALAVPSYQQYLFKSRRGEAINALNAAVQAQERYRSGNASYANSLSILFPSGMQSLSHYTLQLSGVSTTGFTVAARPLSSSPQSSDADCAVLSISLTGGVASYVAKTASGANSTVCWPR